MIRSGCNLNAAKAIGQNLKPHVLNEYKIKNYQVFPGMLKDLLLLKRCEEYVSHGFGLLFSNILSKGATDYVIDKTHSNHRRVVLERTLSKSATNLFQMKQKLYKQVNDGIVGVFY